MWSLLLDEDDGDEDEDAGDPADENSGGRAHECAGGGDRDQAGEHAVGEHGRSGLP